MKRHEPTLMAFVCIASVILLSVMVSISTAVGIVTLVNWVGG